MIELDERLADQCQIYTDRIVPPSYRLRAPDASGRRGRSSGLGSDADDCRRAPRRDRVGLGGRDDRGRQARRVAHFRDFDAVRLLGVGHVAPSRARPEARDPSFVFMEYAAPDDCDLDDRDAWRTANPALGDFLHDDAIRGDDPAEDPRERVPALPARPMGRAVRLVAPLGRLGSARGASARWRRPPARARLRRLCLRRLDGARRLHGRAGALPLRRRRLGEPRRLRAGASHART